MLWNDTDCQTHARTHKINVFVGRAVKLETFCSPGTVRKDGWSSSNCWFFDIFVSLLQPKQFTFFFRSRLICNRLCVCTTHTQSHTYTQFEMHMRKWFVEMLLIAVETKIQCSNRRLGLIFDVSSIVSQHANTKSRANCYKKRVLTQFIP